MSVSSSTAPPISSSQYISPDFFPSSALDAKNSPLALLVQTCSSIGKESQSNKNNNNDKKELPINLNNLSNNSNNNHNNNNTNSYSKEGSHRQKSNSPSDKACKGGGNSGGNEERKKSFNGLSNSTERKETNKQPSSNNKSSPNNKSAGFKVPATNNFGDRFMEKYTNGFYSEKYLGYNDELAALAAANGRYFPGYSNGLSNNKNNNSMFPYMEGNNQDLLSKNPFYPLYNSMKLQEAAALQNASNFPGLSNLYPSLFGYPFQLDPLAAAAAAAAAYSANFVAAAAAAATQQKPSPSNNHSSPRRCVSSLCKDPYCNGQHLPASTSTPSIHKNHSPSSHKNCNTPGCNQCPEKNHITPNHPSADQLQAAASLFYPGGLPSSSFCLPPFNPLMLSSGLASSFLNQSINPLPSSPSQPLTCNWVQSSEYCGKKFTNSEEFLLHLHGHTAASPAPPSSKPSSEPPKHSSITPSSQPLPPFNPAALPPLPFSLPNLFGLNPQRTSTTPSSRSPPPPQNYPFSQLPSNNYNPNGYLSSSRYHPYKSSSRPLTPPSINPSQSSPFPPSLAAYYSPYNLYNQRLGSTAGP